MGLSTQDGDITHRNGTFTFAGSVKLPATCVGDANIDPVSPLGTSKSRRRISKTYRQANGSANVAEQSVVHVVYGAVGAIIAIRGGIRTACIAPSKTTVDVKKNGVSILTAAFDITSASAAFALVAASIASAGLVTGDVLEVVVTLTGGGTQGQGLFVDILVDEDPS